MRRKPVGYGYPFGNRSGLALPAMIAFGLLVATPLSAQDNANITPNADASISQTDREPDIEPASPATIESRTTRRADGSAEIDILADAKERYGPPAPVDDCSAEQEAAIISGEIIVCRRKRDQSRFQTLNPDGAQARYADETAFRDDPKAPDFISDCNDQGWPAGCVRIGKVPEPALIIDVAALPQAPPGSDADRIARGLPPLNQSDISRAEEAAPVVQP
jgi:hypothetical protein